MIFEELPPLKHNPSQSLFIKVPHQKGT